jgi:hypothetical protein
MSPCVHLSGVVFTDELMPRHVPLVTKKLRTELGFDQNKLLTNRY